MENIEQNSAEEVSTPEVSTEEPQIQEVPETNPDVSSDQPVTSLDEAKKVLQATKKQKAPAPTEKPSTSPQDIDYKKQYTEITKLVGKQSKELGELRKFYQENQPVINAYKKLMEQQQEQELLSKYQEDPMAVVKELARREALQQVAPYQEQISQAQATTINANLKEQLGADYDVLAPVMADMLDNFLEMDNANGTNYASELASNPQILVQMAAGRLALQNRTQQAQNAQQAQAKKAQNLQAAQGVAKVNNTKSAPINNFNELPLDDMRAQMVKLGIVK